MRVVKLRFYRGANRDADERGRDVEGLHLLVDLGEDLRVTNEKVFVFTDLDRVTTPAGKKNLVTGLDRGGDDFAVLVGSTGASSDDASFGKGRGSGGGRKEDTSGGLGLGLEALDEDAVEERDDRLDRADGGLSSLFRVGTRVVQVL